MVLEKVSPDAGGELLKLNERFLLEILGSAGIAASFFESGSFSCICCDGMLRSVGESKGVIVDNQLLGLALLLILC